MIEANLNIFDAVVFAIIAASSLLAFFRGFVRELLSLSAWACAGIVTLYFFPSAAAALQGKFKSAVVAAGISTLGIYTVSLMFFSLINTAILKFIKSGTDVGMLDNSLGFIFGFARGFFLIALGFFIMTIVLPEEEYPELVKTSVSLPYVERSALALARVSPKYLRNISTLNRKLTEEEERAKGGLGKVGNKYDYKDGKADPKKTESTPEDSLSRSWSPTREKPE